MADTKRYQAIKNIRDKLKEITIANGYEIDLGGRVYIGKIEHGKETPAPFIALWEPFSENGPTVASDAPKQSGSGQRRTSQSRIVVGYYIQGFADKASDPAEPTAPAYVLLGAIQRCLGALSTESRPFGADQQPGEITLDWGLVRPGGDNLSTEHSYALIKLNLLIQEERGSPYVQ
tara:strand:+ start:1091 stop:1618 length:528 start_codon:yes stop_codon:yes gene_type:complete